VLASATVTTSDPKEGSPISFYSHAISPVSLAANTTYYIAEDLGSSTTANANVTGLTTASEITYEGEVAAMGQGMNPDDRRYWRNVLSRNFRPQFRHRRRGDRGAGARQLGAARRGVVGLGRSTTVLPPQGENAEIRWIFNGSAARRAEIARRGAEQGYILDELARTAKFCSIRRDRIAELGGLAV
jgi:hypothetical protein